MARPERRRIVRWPVEVLVTPAGVDVRKVDDVGVSEVKAMLRGGCRSIAIINIGDSPRWCIGEDALAAWRTEIRDFLVEPAEVRRGVSLGDVPGDYFYVGSRWSASGSDGDVLVFFMNH